MKIQKNTLIDQKPNYQKPFILILLILILTWIAYYPSLHNGFTNWDDPNYVYKNATIQQLNKETTKRLLTESHMGNYHPISMISLAFDYSIGKLKPKTYHTTNLILHLANTILVYIFIYMLTGKIELAAITSILFGIHTLHVESVAWISERKDVMYTLFFLASLIFYIKYLKDNKLKFYFISILLFILSCLSKGMAVSLSLCLIAIDYLFTRNLLDKKTIIEKIPFFILSLAFGIIAIKAQHLGPDTEGIPHYNIFKRLIFASYGTTQYLIKLIVPTHLSAFYPYPETGDLPLYYWLSPLIILGIAAVTFYFARTKRFVVFSILFFLINIILVLQILPVGKAIMADRYAYIPSIGFFLLIGLAYEKFSGIGTTLKRISLILFCTYSIFITYFTFERCKVWKDSFSLWSDVIEKFSKVGIAYNNLGVAYADINSYQKSIENYNQAIKIDPLNSEAYNNKGVALSNLKEYKEAIRNYDLAIASRNNYADAFYNRANAFINLEDPQRAIIDYDKVLQLNPHHSGALNNRGLARRMVNNYNGALEDFNLVIRLFPNNAEAYANRSLVRMDLKDFSGAAEDKKMAHELNPLSINANIENGDAKVMQNDFQGAILEFTNAINNDPKNFDAYMKRGLAKIKVNDIDGAITDMSNALNIVPTNPEIYLQRGIAKNSKGEFQSSIEDYNKAIELKTDYSEAYCNRGISRFNLKNIKGAMEDYDKAIMINPVFTEAYSNRGLLKMNLKDFKGALIDYNKCIELNPDFGLAYSNRGALYYNMGNLKAACEDWKRGSALNEVSSKNYLDRFCK